LARITACAAGSIQVVTKVARFLWGSPSRTTSLSSSASAVSGAWLWAGNSRIGAGFVKKRSAMCRS
jgi:hypothetical protein